MILKTAIINPFYRRIRMKSLTLKVPGISCSHCEMSIKKALNAIGITEVAVDIKNKTVALEYDSDKVSYDMVKTAIGDQGYDIASI